jgi:hypothetical protein
MTKRENLLKLYRREGTEEVPVGMHFCPSLADGPDVGLIQVEDAASGKQHGTLVDPMDGK